MPETSKLLMNLILYGVLPLWGVVGFVDWCCHRASRIETTSGLKESLIHALMGTQLGIPILLCLLFDINVMILLICMVTWLAHEVVAHWDVRYSAPVRHISIWEVHAHNYLATIPLYLLMSILVLNWEVFLKLISFDWGGQFGLHRVASSHGGSSYMPAYLIFMGVLNVFPYFEENLRCLRVVLSDRGRSR